MTTDASSNGTKREEILERLKSGVIDYDTDRVVAASNEAVELELDAYEMIMQGLAAGMGVVGDYFDCGDYFVPEVLLCAEALYAGLNILRPHISEERSRQVKGQVVIGVVQGDVHDIGKNMVKMMFEVAGFTVHDLGYDVPLDEFVKEQLDTESEIVCLSSMMTTTMMGMPKVIKMIHEKNPSVKIMVGGSPVTEDLATQFGADGYATDATNAVSDAIRMVGALQDM
jgi:corrinoid protein of di/trimethylamine methyltransferase|tara:strand:- start:726 stop:1406 length:681 start_codon:yes stop_codon:yes gene_type:complete